MYLVRWVGVALAVLAGASAALAREGAQDADWLATLTSVRPATRAELLASGGAPLATLPRYRLNLTLSSDLRVFSLTEEVTYTNNEASPVADLAFRVFANRTAQPPPVAVGDVDCGPTPCDLVRESPSAIRVIPRVAIAPGGSLRIRLVLAGKLRVIAPGETDMMSQGMNGMVSLFGAPTRATDYGLLAFGDGIASLANFHAVLASRRQGKWVTTERTTMGDLTTDEMAMVQAWVTTPSDVSIAATGTEKLLSTSSDKNTYSVQAGLNRDFALLASRDFVSVSRALGDVTIRSSFVKGDDVSGMQVLDTATDALKVFESRFGPYPYCELDIVEAPLVGGAGGVEFSGLATVASMFYRPSSGGLEELTRLFGGGSGVDFRTSALEFTSAHEVAHQYWHGLVGTDSRTHAFADESLTQWSTLLYLEERYGAARAKADAEQHVLMSYRMMRLLGQPDGPVDRPVDGFASPIAYAGLVYGKGPFLYSGLRGALGDREFFAGLRRYTARYRFLLAPSDGLFTELASSPRRAREVRRLTQRYLREAHGDEDLGSPSSLGDPLMALLGRLGRSSSGGDSAGGGIAPIGPPTAGHDGGERDEQVLQLLLQGLEDAGGVDGESRRLLEELIQQGQTEAPLLQ